MEITALLLIIILILILTWKRNKKEKIYFQNEIEKINKQKEEILKLQDEIKKLELEKREKLEIYEKEYSVKVKELNEIDNQISAAIEVLKNIHKEKEQKNFNRIQIPSSEVQEARQILELSNSFPKITKTLKEVVFKFYYYSYITQMIKRVTNGRRITGIYKITEIETGKCYIGQSVDIGNRWMTHCKRVFGLEVETSNALYPALRRIGIENVTFEIIQECEQSELNKLEKYWQNVLQAKTFGYSIK